MTNKTDQDVDQPSLESMIQYLYDEALKRARAAPPKCEHNWVTIGETWRVVECTKCRGIRE